MPPYVQNMHRIKQRKGLCFFQVSSADEDDKDDKDDEYDSGFYPEWMPKICVALNKEKAFTSFRQWVTMRTTGTMIWLPHSFQNFRTQV